MRITKAIGNGQSECKRCHDNNIWSLTWTSMLYRIEGMERLYCYNCVQEIAREKGEKLFYNSEEWINHHD